MVSSFLSAEESLQTDGIPHISATVAPIMNQTPEPTQECHNSQSEEEVVFNAATPRNDQIAQNNQHQAKVDDDPGILEIDKESNKLQGSEQLYFDDKQQSEQSVPESNH